MTFSDEISLPDHSSGSATPEDFDPETAALIAKLALDDLSEFLPVDFLPLDKELVHNLQAKEYNEWYSIAQNAKITKSIVDTLMTDTAYLDAFLQLKRTRGKIQLSPWIQSSHPIIRN
jgi:hypothetical protein